MRAMSTRKVTISLPEDLYQHALARQKQLGFTRSMLIQQLLRADKRATEKKAAAEVRQQKASE